MLSGAGGWRGRIVLQVTLRSCLTSETNRHRYTVYACVCQFIQSRCTKTHLDLDQVPLQVLHFFHKNEMVLQNRCKQTMHLQDIEMTISMARKHLAHIYIYSATFFSIFVFWVLTDPRFNGMLWTVCSWTFGHRQCGEPNRIVAVFCPLLTEDVDFFCWICFCFYVYFPLRKNEMNRKINKLTLFVFVFCSFSILIYNWIWIS